MKVTFDHSQPGAEHIRIFWFKPEKPMRYTAGQFTEFQLPHQHEDDRGHKRWFTLSSSPTEPMLAITTKFADPSSSFKSALSKLKPGDQLDFAEAMGDFVLPKDPSIPILFVAGGIGVTPMRSMAKYLLDTQQKRSVKLLYTASQESELAFLPLFKQAGVELVVNIGKLNAQQIVAEAKDPNTIIYLSGPEPMVEELVADTAKQWPKDQIRTDFFPGYSAI